MYLRFSTERVNVGNQKRTPLYKGSEMRPVTQSFSSKMAWTERMRKYCFRKTKKKTELIDLPRDIIIDILMRLPLKTLCSLRCVSKTLLNRLDDALFVNLLTTTNAAAEVPLQLMSLTRSELFGSVKMEAMEYDVEALTAEENKHASQVFASSKPFSVKYHFDFCYYNLFFFREESGEHPCFLSNPLRGEVLKLPANNFPAQENRFHLSYGMGFDTITNTHKIVCMSSNFEEDYLGAQVLVLGTSSWKEIPSLPPCYLGEQKICAHGDMHWLSDSEGLWQIISFDFTKEEFYLTPHPTSIPSDLLPYIHLLTWRGSIAIAYASLLDMSIKIWVLKNYDTKEWACSPDYSISIRNDVAASAYGLWPRLVADEYSSLSYCEWEHGIFFMDKFGENIFFLDLRGVSKKYPTGGCPRKHVKIVSYAWSFISLKHYGQLEVEEEAEAEKYGMQPSFLQKFGQCFVGAKKIERVKQRLWRLV